MGTAATMTLAMAMVLSLPMALSLGNLTAGRDSVLEGFGKLRKEGVLSDVTLRVGEERYPAHKFVLAASSDYFKAMFTSQLNELEDREVTLSSIEPEIMESLLQFAYTGDIIISEDNVQKLMMASDYLQVVFVRDSCSRFIEEHLSASNCLRIIRLAEGLHDKRLLHAAKEFAIRNFLDVSAQDEFLNLPRDILNELVSSDALGVTSEEYVFTAVLKWFNHQPDALKDGFYKVLENVRLPLLPPDFLQDRVQQQENVWTSPESQRLLNEARMYNLLPDRRGEMQGVRTRPRNAFLVESTSSDQISSDLITSDVIVCTGGENGSRLLRSVEAFSPATNQWTTLGDLPFAVRGHGAAVTGQNMLYVAGGRLSDDTATNRLVRFDPQLNKWEELAGMGSARFYHGMAAVAHYIYVVGGRDNTFTQLNSVERYNTQTGEWEQLTGLDRITESPAVVAHGGHIYMAGGFTDEGPSYSVQRFDPATRSWSELAPMPTARVGSAGCVLNDTLYIMGGYGGGGSLNTVECYDIHTNQWTRCSPMGTKRWYPGAAVANGDVFAVGGLEGRPRVFHSSMERYSVAGDRWEEVPGMTTARSRLTCTALQVPRMLLAGDRR